MPGEVLGWRFRGKVQAKVHRVGSEGLAPRTLNREALGVGPWLLLSEERLGLKEAEQSRCGPGKATWGEGEREKRPSP